MGGGGFVSALVGSPEGGMIYARTDVGGAYRWDDTGARWIPLLDWVSAGDRGYLGVESLAVDPRAPNRLYLLVGTSYFSGGRSAVLRSEDFGQSFEVVDVTEQFTAHGNGMGRQNGERLQVDPNDPERLYCGTRWDGLFRSVDGGRSWERMESLPVTTTPNETGISFVVIDPRESEGGRSEGLFVGVSRYGENLYGSLDGGARFGAIAGGPQNLMPQRAVLAADGDLYITYGNGSGPHSHWEASLEEPFDAGQVWRYESSTGDWTNVTPHGYSGPFSGIDVDPADPERLVLTTINNWMHQHGDAYGDRILLSTDGGSSWSDVLEGGFTLDTHGHSWIADQAIHWAGSIVFDPNDSRRVWVSSGNGIFQSDHVDTPGGTWEFVVEGLEETVPLDLVSVEGGPLVSVIGDYDGFVHNDVKGHPVRHRPSMGTTTGVAVAASAAEVMLRVGEFLYFTTDGGESWTRTAAQEGENGSVAVSADGSTFLHAPENAAGLYRSTDEGASWAAVSGVSTRGTRPVADPVEAKTFYVYDHEAGRLRVSTDGGEQFLGEAVLPAGGSPRMAVVPGREGQLWVALRANGLMRSTNAGTSFVAIKDVDSCEAVGFGKAAPSRDHPAIYIWGTVGGVEGIHGSIDGGESWYRINDDEHQFGGPGNGSFVMGDRNVFGRVYMSTVGRGIIYGEYRAGWKDWRSRYFEESGGADPGPGAASADPDGDGIPNLLEWMLGMDPRVAEPLFERGVGLGDPGMTIELRHHPFLSEGDLELEVSRDLVDWQPAELLYALDETATPKGEWLRTRRYVPRDENRERIFMRLLGVEP